MLNQYVVEPTAQQGRNCPLSTQADLRAFSRILLILLNAR